jgi:hypothetical protein
VQYSRLATAALAAVSSVALVASLSGCATPGSGSSLSVGGAKQRTIELERSIAAAVPHDKVLSTQITTSSRVIFPCLGQTGESYWPGSGTLKLASGVDTDAVLQALSSKWNDKSGWSAYVTTSASGTKSLALKTGDGYSFTVEFDQGPVFTINALSACFSNAGLAGRTSY